MTRSRTNPLSRRRVLLAGAASATAALTGAAIHLPPATASARPGNRVPRISWTALPDVPSNTDAWTSTLPIGEPHWKQVGLAAMVAGAHGDYLIAAGGANFPEVARTATRDNTLGKVYWAEAFVLKRTASGVEWLTHELRLPDAVAYAATVSTEDGVVVLGGEGFRGGANGNAQAALELFADAYVLRFDAASETLVREDLPDLPRPMSYAVAGVIDDVVYVAQGGDFYSLDLARPAEGWSVLPSWPGDARAVAVGAAQAGRFYLFSGRSQDEAGDWRFHRDAYAYHPARRRWDRISDLPWCVTAGLAHPVGKHQMLVVGGDKDLDRWNLIEAHSALRRAAPPGSDEWHAHNDVVTWLFDHHTGFNTELLLYDVRKDSWQILGHFPGSPPATAPAVSWGDDLIIVSGEVGPGIRTPKVWKASFAHGRPMSA
ncbi:galactose oxidase [Phytoactinopolyspora alkaliphila]|uniref:Galactose oxidase n=1 Tax=Phytoactinopolyspora alkaliphila TaxID=1783498 RepID=A0A6N9YTL1_9ACTN|nr:galactose oxidase [Phytoactinopolyspora alkaliphila]NED98304.1 galactose oxidase [Phytoactinopolyspora alkaliphila]